MKVTNLDLHNRVRELKGQMRDFTEKFEWFEGFDPTEYMVIKDDPSFEMLWHYKNTYYRHPSELYPVAVNQGYSKTKQSWARLLKDTDKQKQFNIYEINLVYVSWFNEYHGVTTHGDIVKRKSLNKLKKNNNGATIYENGERDTYNIGSEVYRRFINRNFDSVKVHHLNNIMVDCRIDNIELSKEEREAEMRGS